MHRNAQMFERACLQAWGCCRLKIKMVARVTMDNLVAHLSQKIADWPQQQMQALEIVLASPFINNTEALLYKSRTLFELNQVLFHCVYSTSPAIMRSSLQGCAYRALPTGRTVSVGLMCCPASSVNMNSAYYAVVVRSLVLTVAVWLLQTAVSVGNGGEAWIGYKQDLRPCQFGLMMSVEPSFSVFYEGLAVVDYTQAVLTKNPTRPWEWTNDFLTPAEQKEISKELKGVVVRVPAFTGSLKPCMLLSWGSSI